MKHKINAEGFYICSYTEDYEYFQDEWILIDENLPNDNFIKLKWDFQINEWTEGASQEEIDIANSAPIPLTISRMNLKIELLKRNIQISEIVSTINSIPDYMFPPLEKEIAIIKFNEATSFDRYNADLNLVATLMGLTQEDLDDIFIKANNL
jgi:hypothetical protein